MFPSAASPRSRRSANAAVGFVAAVMLVLTVKQYWASQEIDTVLAAQSRTLADLRDKAAAAGMSHSGEKSDDRPAFYIAGDTVAIAGAALQNIVTRIVEDHGAAVSQVEFLPLEEDGNRRAALRLSFLAKSEHVQKILFDIESRQPLMLVSTLSLRASSIDATSADGEDMLRTVMTVESYLSPEGR